MEKPEKVPIYIQSGKSPITEGKRKMTKFNMRSYLENPARPDWLAMIYGSYGAFRAYSVFGPRSAAWRMIAAGQTPGLTQAFEMLETASGCLEADALERAVELAPRL
jgi:hypothetical protein